MSLGTRLRREEGIIMTFPSIFNTVYYCTIPSAGAPFIPRLIRLLYIYPRHFSALHFALEHALYTRFLVLDIPFTVALDVTGRSR